MCSGSTRFITTKLSLYIVYHLCIVFRVATVDLPLVNEHKGQWGMHDRKKSAFRENIYIYTVYGQWDNNSTLTKFSARPNVDVDCS